MAKSGLRMAATGYELARSRIYRVAVGDFLKMQLPNNFRQIYWPALSTFPPIGASPPPPPPPPPPCHLVCFHSSPSSSKLKTKTFFLHKDTRWSKDCSIVMMHLVLVKEALSIKRIITFRHCGLCGLYTMQKGPKIVFYGTRPLLFLQCLNVNVLFYKGGFF